MPVVKYFEEVNKVHSYLLHELLVELILVLLYLTFTYGLMRENSLMLLFLQGQYLKYYLPYG